ncbi:phospholipase D-like domain-containing protein [Aporhodopirellula aestuarii]|uniref:PLD phosphodiesterase domain-containing protein n=1 Tax=Aporhodopirellula aestuarii TaxID=2950107 RepID=A0ABT0U1W1_9BACT|nr:hypothetical protein [Aporhodopirellula aestuarii]MCM2370629.1 hypothetical protein [Aporhodopirellula aestuarii]
MTFFSESLIDDQFVRSLRADLDRADVCRFLVAYISSSGVDQIGINRLCSVLENELSFGVGSMSCACGFKPLVDLQSNLPLDPPRLKYFLDPAIQKSDEPDDIALMHSKVIYLRVMIDNEPRSVVYIGSHNWSTRALGGSTGPRNAEASHRFEFPFKEEHLEGRGDEMPAQVNRHLRSAYASACCLEATEPNQQTFEEWTQAACKNRTPSSLDEVLLILAVRLPVQNGQPPLSRLRGKGIYLQCLEEDEGSAVWKAPDQTLLLVWDNPEDLAAGEQPTILVCNKGTRNPSQTSELRGTNQADDPIRGFDAVLFDQKQLELAEGDDTPSRSQHSTRKSTDVQIFDFEYPAAHSDCKDYDRSVSPKYQYLLDVTAVVDPADRSSTESQYIWDRSTFAVAHDRKEARYEKIEGYVVSDERYQKIVVALERDFGIQLREVSAKALPNPESRVKRVKLGKRFATSPVHETFISEQVEKFPDELYFKVSEDLLAPNLDPPDNDDVAKQSFLFVRDAKVVERSQRVFTTKIEKLKEVWKHAAQMKRGKTQHPDGRK